MTIFFDVDDTLYDRGLPFINAVEEYFSGAITDPREAYRACASRGNEVFLPSQRGEISMDEMYIYRWSKGLEDVGISIRPEEALTLQKLYRQKQNSIVLSPIREEILRYCADHADGVGVITNGPSEKQWNKIRCLALERFMNRDMILISGDVGIDKPDKRIFDLAQMRSGAEKNDLIYVGDSLKNDIEPASAYGWHTIWFNCDALPILQQMQIDAIAGSEEELFAEVRKLLACPGCR